MIHSHRLVALFASLAIAPTLAPARENEPAPAEKPKQAPIEWQDFDASDFGAKLAKAAAAGEKWAATPESIILEFVGPFVSKEGEKASQRRTIRINTQGEDVPKTLNVVLVDDGLFDDSIQTARLRLTLARSKDGRWVLRRASRANVKWPKP